MRTPSPRSCWPAARDSTFAMFDGLTGTSQQEFPGFKLPTSYFVPLDTDADSSTELYFGRQPGEPPLFTAYEWNGSTYATALLPRAAHGIMGSRSAPQLLPVGVPGDGRHRHPGARRRPSGGHLPGLDRPSGLVGDCRSRSRQRVSNTRASPESTICSCFDDAQFRVVVYDNTVAVPGFPGTAALRVFQNAPNPFRTATAFRISNPREGEVGIRIFDAGGRLVRRLDRRLPAGMSEIQWDGRDDRGRSAPSGVLFYKVTADGIRQTRKLIRTQ